MSLKERLTWEEGDIQIEDPAAHELARNDTTAALAFYRAGCTPEEASTLLSLQDDPEPLALAIQIIDEQHQRSR